MSFLHTTKHEPLRNESVCNEPWQRGSVLTEYIVVMLAMVVVWLTVYAVLELLQEHHEEYSWALQLPF